MLLPAIFLCSNFKNVGNEFGLPINISCFYSLNLPIANRVNRLVVSQDLPICVEVFEPESWIDQSSYWSVFLFENN